MKDGRLTSYKYYILENEGFIETHLGMKTHTCIMNYLMNHVDASRLLFRNPQSLYIICSVVSSVWMLKIKSKTL